MSNSTQDPLPLLSLPDTFGALYITGNFAAVLFGLTNVQAFIYFRIHRGTKLTFLKLAIIFLWTLDGLHLASIIHSVYYYLITDHANITPVSRVVWSFKLQVLIDILIIYAVHLLYAHRLWIVSKGRSRVLPITVGIIVALMLGVYILLFWAIYRCNVMEDLAGNVWMTFVTLGAITAVDFIIASSLCYLFATSRTGFSGTDSVLANLMVYTINTGCLTSIFSMAGIVTCAVMPKNFIFLGIEFLMAKVYVNSFLALLNAQYYLHPSMDAVNPSQYHVHPSVYRQELHLDASQDENSQTFRMDTFKHPDQEALDLIRPVSSIRR